MKARALLQWGSILSWVLASGCSSGVDAGLSSSTLTADSIGTSETDTSRTFTGASGTGYTTVTVDQGTAFTFENICRGTTIFGRLGYANCGASHIARDVGSTQISSAAEVKTYAGTGSTPTLPSNLREVPDVSKDDDGYYTADASCVSNCSPALPITLATHTGYTDCGTSQSTIEARIADCASKNGSSATWNPGTNGIRGEATWKLVARNGSRKEVWQDQRTGLLWSSLVSNANRINWCIASGNSQTGDTYCASTNYQPATPQSMCAEGTGIIAPAGTCSVNTCGSIGRCITSALCTGAGGTWTANTEDYSTGTYSAAKGQMGARSTPGVKWKLPSLHDYLQAEIDGIRMVMPDMGATKYAITFEWTSTVYSSSRTTAWRISTEYPESQRNLARDQTFAVRCVGR